MPSQKSTAPAAAPRRRRRGILHKIGFALKLIVLLILVTGLVGGTACVLWIHSVIEDAPGLDMLAVAPSQSASYICDSEGNHLRKLTLPEANRDIVSIDSIPLDLQHAFVAIEDKRFYTHHGIDPQGILRAAWIGLTTGHFSEGASTITQQLLKNSVFTDWMSESTFEESLTRKVQEQYLALQLEKIVSKPQILEDYLNTINLGAGCYGVQSAAYRYFGKDVSQLTLSECAVIAGITQNPTAYNPLVYPENNRERRQLVLDAMLEQGYIRQSDYDEAIADPVYERIAYHEESADTSSSVYTYYEDALIDQVISDLMDEKGYTYVQAYRAVYSGGLRIYSAQDSRIQQICDEAFADSSNFPEDVSYGIDYALSVQSNGITTHYGNADLTAYVQRTSDSSFNLLCDSAGQAQAYADAFRASIVSDGDVVLGERVTITPQPQASAVIIEQAAGLVRAIAGGRGSKEASLTLNRASYTTRQPGSTFKVVTAFAAALDACGKTLATSYANRLYTLPDGSAISNWDLNDYSDTATIREAIVRSINVVAVECLVEITPQLGYEYAQKMGISTLVESYTDESGQVYTDLVPSLALGGITNGVTALELGGAYACLANLGQYITPRFYTQVTTAGGEMVLDNTAPAARTAVKDTTAYLLTRAMQDVISDPEGTACGYIDLGDMAVAGKSGTTSDYRDIWFAGYSPYYTCCVWGGYDNNSILPDTDRGHNYSKILWNSMMSRISELDSAADFSEPSGIVRVPVCHESGEVAVSGCDAYTEYFTTSTQPARYCSVHGSGASIYTDQTSETDGSLSGTSTPDIAISSDDGAIVIYSSDQASVTPDTDAASNTPADASAAADSTTPVTTSSAETSAAPSVTSDEPTITIYSDDDVTISDGVNSGDDSLTAGQQQILDQIPDAG